MYLYLCLDNRERGSVKFLEISRPSTVSLVRFWTGRVAQPGTGAPDLQVYSFPETWEFLLSGFIETICATRTFTNTETASDYKLTSIPIECLIAIPSNPRIILAEYLAKSVSSSSKPAFSSAVYVWASTYTSVAPSVPLLLPNTSNSKLVVVPQP